MDRQVERGLRNLERKGYNGEAQQIRAFLEAMVAREGISVSRQRWYLSHLRGLVSHFLQEAFLHPTEEDLERVVGEIEASDRSAWGKQNYRVVIKRFYKWLLGGNEEYPPEVRWIKTTARGVNNRLPNDLLTEEEMAQLIRAAQNPRDRALIALLADTGVRIGEALGLRVEDFHEDPHGAYLMVSGKTGDRRVRLIESVPWLKEWLANHPLAKEAETPLFVTLASGSRGGPGRPLDYAAARKAVQMAAKRAGVKKRVNLHKFRHSRATILAKTVPEHPLEAYMGWVPGSKMAQVYVALSGRDVDDVILKAHGIDVEEVLLPKVCPWCSQENTPYTRLCRACGLPLIEKKEVEKVRRRMREQVEKEIEIRPLPTASARQLIDAMKDPAFRQAFKNLVKEELGTAGTPSPGSTAWEAARALTRKEKGSG